MSKLDLDMRHMSPRITDQSRGDAAGLVDVELDQRLGGQQAVVEAAVLIAS